MLSAALHFNDICFGKIDRRSGYPIFTLVYIVKVFINIKHILSILLHPFRKFYITFIKL
jgi:hypothetical protein